MSEIILRTDQRVTKGKEACSTRNRTAQQKELSGSSQLDLRTSENIIEILVEGQECPFCHFAKLKREGDEIVCPICGYGHKACT